jgi:hypothetical protein
VINDSQSSYTINDPKMDPNLLNLTYGSNIFLLEHRWNRKGKEVPKDSILKIYLVLYGESISIFYFLGKNMSLMSACISS